MTKLPDITLLTARQIEEVLKTCDSYLGKKLGLDGAIENTNLPIVVSSLNLSWLTIDLFENDLNFWTKQKNIRSTYTELYKVWEQKLVQEKSGKVEKTTLTPEEMEKLEKEAEKQKQQKAQSTAKSQKDIEQFVKQQKAIAEEAKRAKETLKDKKIYVKVSEPEPIKLTSDEQKAFNNLQSMAQETPHILVKNITKTIEEKLLEIIKGGATPEEIHYYAEVVAVKAVDNLRAEPKPVDKDPVVLASLSNHSEILDKLDISEADKKFITKASSDLATLKMLPYRTNQQILASVFGKNITEKILGPDPTTLNVTFTDQPQESTDSVPLDRLAENYQTVAESPIFSQIQSFGVDEIKGKLIDYGKEKVLGQISKLPADSFLGKIAASEKFSGIINLLKPAQTIEATNLFGKLIMNFSPEFAPVVSGLGQLIGVDFGLISVPATAVVTPVIIPMEAIAIQGAVTTTPTIIATAGQVAKKGLSGLNIALGNAVARGGAAIFSKIGLTAASKVLAGMVGTGLAGPVGFIVTQLAFALFGKLIEKIGPWIKKHQDDLKIAGLITLGGGAITSSIPILIIGGLIFIPAALKTGFSLAGIAARTTFLFGRIGASMAITIGTPIIVAIIVFPILVAIILFIINSGAYLVPPSQSAIISNLINPYIGVEKVASPAGPFQNSQLPFTVTYSVTVSAKKGVLTNVVFSDECQAIKKTGPVPCPTITLPDPPETISPPNPYVFDYSVTYEADTYSDSAVINNIKVTADTVDAGGQTATGGMSIIIGDPPTACFTFDNTWDAYPSYKAQMMGAIAELSKATTYMSTLCAGHTIPLSYTGQPLGYAGEVIGGTIYFHVFGLSLGAHGTLYTLTHETGHLYAAWIPGKLSTFLYNDGVKSEGFLCTYLLNQTQAEDFPETIALFVSHTSNTNNACLTNYKTQYPNHWQFARNNIFYSNLDW